MTIYLLYPLLKKTKQKTKKKADTFNQAPSSFPKILQELKDSRPLPLALNFIMSEELFCEVVRSGFSTMQP